MAQRKSTLSKNFLEKLQEKNSNDESQKIQTPSGGTNVTVETLVALSGLMAAIWGGSQALSAVKEGFDPKSVIKGQGNKFGLRDLFVMSDKIMQDIIKNDKHVFSKTGGEKALSLINSIDTNIKKIISPLTESLKGAINTQQIKLDVSGNFNAKEYKELLESFTDPSLDRLTEEDFVHGFRLVIDTLKQFDDLQLGKLTGNVSTQLANLVSVVDENVANLKNIDNIRVKILEFKQGIEDIHIDTEAGVFKDLQNIIEKMSIIASYDTKNISLEPIIDAIGMLNDEKLQKILESSNSTLNFENLKRLIENEDSGLNGVILAIKKIGAEGENLDQKSSEGIIGVTNAIATILSIDTSLTSVIKLQKSIQLMKPLFEKDLKELVAVIIKNFGDKETKTVLSQLRNIQGIFSVISSLGINPLRIVAANINIKMIKGTLIKNVLELFKEIAEATNENKEPYKDAVKGINNLREIIKLITGVSSMPLNRKIGMLIDFEYVRALVLPTIKRILSSIIDINSDYKESVTRSIQDLSTLFETLTKIADIKDETLSDMREKVQELDFIIDSDLRILFEGLKKLPVSKDDITKSEKINAFIASMVSQFDAMPGLLKFYLAEEKYDVISELAKTTSMIVDTVNNIKITKSTLKKYDNINELLNKVQILLALDVDSTGKKLKNISQSIEDLNDAVLQMIKISGGSKAIELSARVYAKIPDILKNFVEGFKDINKDDIDNATKIIKEMNKIVIISAGVLLFAALASMVIPMKDVFQFAMSLGLFILMFSGAIRLATPKLLKDSHETIHEFGNLILTSAFVMLFGSIIYNLIELKDLFGFTATLGLFMWGMMAILANNNIQTDIENSWETMREFGYLILISGATLILGSVIYHFLEWKDLFGFALGLGVFMFAMTGIYAVLSTVIDQALEGAKDFALIVTASGFVLILGALLNSAISWGDVFGFTFKLTVFLGTMMALFAAPQILSAYIPGLANPFEQAMDGAKDFAILILASGFTLFLGAAISKAVDWKSLTLFTVELAAFIIGVSLAYRIATFNNKGSMRGAKQFAILLGVSAMILIIGGMFFTWLPEIIPGSALFVAILGGFMIGICTAYRIATKGISSRMKAAYQIALLVAVSGGILLFAGWVMHKFPDAKITIPIFTGCVLALNGGMALILNQLSKSSASLKKGIIAMLSISAALGITSLAFKKLAETAAIIQNCGGVGKFSIIVATMLGTLAVVSAGIVALAFALGNGATTAMAYLAIGVVLAGASAIWVVANAMEKTAKALDTLSKVKPIKVDQLLSNVSAILSVAGALAPLVTMTPAIVASSLAVESMARMLSSIAKAIQDYASLKIPIYEGMKQVGYRQLGEEDFKEASKNVSLIIKTLGKAVIDAYEQNPQIFKANLLGFGKSKFQIVAKSLGTLGPMLSSIAESVQQYASLRVGIDYKKNSMGILMPTNYRQLNKEDFNSAARNVKEIITVLGRAVIKIYDENPEIFKEPSFFGKSKFSKVVKSLTGLGNMLAKIAGSVKDYADLKVGEDYQKDSKFGILMPTKYRHLKDKDFKDAARNVALIMTTLGNAVIKVYEANPKYYETSGGVFGFGSSSPFTKTIKANMMLGTMISSIAKGIQNYASLKYPTEWDSKGNPIKFQKMEDTDISDAANKISQILITIGNAVAKAADNEIFNKFNIVKVNNMLDSMKKTSSVINMMAKTIHKYATMEFIEYDLKTKTKSVQKITQPEIRQATESIGEVLTTIGKAIVNTVSGNTTIFGDNIQESPAYMAAMSVGKMGEALNIIARSIALYAKDIFPVITYNNGKINTRMYKLNEGDYDKAEKTIKKVITAIGRVLKATYDENPTLFSTDDNGHNTTENIIKGISGMTNAISKIVTEVQKVAKLNVTDIITKLSESDNSLKNAIALISSMYATLTQDSGEIEKKTETHLFGDDTVTQRNLSIGEQWAKNSNKLKAIIIGCKSLFGATNSVFSTINGIAKLSATDNTKKLEKIVENLTQYITGFKNISKAFIGIPIFTGISDDNTINNNLDMIEKLVDRLLPILNKINGIKDGGELKILLSLTETFMNIVARLKGMVSDKDENKIDFSTFNFEDSSKDLNTKINLFADNVDRVIDLSEHSKEIGTEGLENVSHGISEVDRVLQEIKGIENFTKHNIQLDKYVQTVNKLQLSKINGLTDMIKAMNTLTNRLGNVDRLTEAIADKLSGVLDRLVSEMKEAEKIIKESEVIQKKRHALIEKSTKNVVEIMKQKLVVEISQVQDTAGLGPGAGTGTGTGTQSGDGAGTPPSTGNITDGNDRGNSSNSNTSQETSEGGTKVVAQSRGGNSTPAVYPGGNGSRNSSRTDTLLDGILAELKRGIKIKQ